MTPSKSTALVDGDVLAGSGEGKLKTGWNEVTVDSGLLQPGLYVVSANYVIVHAQSKISDVAPNATPSLLTIVGGSFADQSSPITTFPDRIYHDATYTTAYFWLDVTFRPPNEND